jgi:signal peptidase II
MPARKQLITAAMAIMALVIALDQLSKWLILDKVLIPPEHSPLTVAPFLNIVLVWNYGISFGIFSSHRQPLLLTLMSVAIIGILLVWLYKNTSRLTAYALGSVIGGALGNVIDRLRFEAVVDFLDFHAGKYHWPAFNVADSCIFIGVVLLCGSSMFTSPSNSLKGSSS